MKIHKRPSVRQDNVIGELTKFMSCQHDVLKEMHTVAAAMCSLDILHHAPRLFVTRNDMHKSPTLQYHHPQSNNIKGHNCEK
jgi:hypothetical protein